MLLFKKQFLPAIRAGRKTQTVRLWKYRRMRTGQRSYIPGCGYIVVEAVEPLRLEELTEEDALRDGFASLPQLLDELVCLYEEQLAAGYQVYRVRFRLVDRETAMAIPRLTSKPSGR